MKETEETLSEKEKLYNGFCAHSLALYMHKNADYGDSYAMLRKEYPDICAIHLQEKVNRLKSLFHAEAQVNESKRDTLFDIVGYALMELVEMDCEEESK